MPAQQLETSKSRSAVSSLANNASSQALIRSSYEVGESSYRELGPSLKGSASPVFILPGSQESGLNGEGMGKARGDGSPSKRSPNYVTKTQWTTVAILTFVNLINYMDRYTIAGILRDVQEQYQIDDSKAGALQTAFVIFYMLFAPLFGYFGDRHSRKLIMAFGVLIWVAATLIGSFMSDYYSFLSMRAIVGIGEASYSTIAPTIISDMFVKEARSKMLAIFYFAIPVGSGLGYVIGGALASAFGNWQWALRGTPILGMVAVLLIIFVMVEPPRGEAEGHDQLKATDYKKDLKSLTTNMSFVFSTLGFTCVSFCTGALAWWGPKYIQDAILSMEVMPEDRPMQIGRVSLVFGAVTMVSGMLGVPLGMILSTVLREKYPRSDPLICGIGLVLSSIFIFVAFFFSRVDVLMGFALVFIGEVALNLNWSIVADILLYVVVPTRRSTAEAIQILISHLLGDAGSPYLIGVASEWLKSGAINKDEYCHNLLNSTMIVDGGNNSTRCDIYISYYSMQYALIGNVVVEILGGIFFFIAAIFVVRDRLRVQEYLAKHSGEQNMFEKTPFNDQETPDETDDDEPIPKLIESPFKRPQLKMMEEGRKPDE